MWEVGSNAASCPSPQIHHHVESASNEQRQRRSSRFLLDDGEHGSNDASEHKNPLLLQGFTPQLVQGQEVACSNRLVTTILSPHRSMRYAAFPSASSISFCGQYGQLLWFCLEFGRPALRRLQYRLPRQQASSQRVPLSKARFHRRPPAFSSP